MISEKSRSKISIIKACYKYGQKLDGVQNGPHVIVDTKFKMLFRDWEETVCKPVGDLGFGKEIHPYYLHEPEKVGQACREVYEATKKSSYEDKILVLGGDHSVAIGSITGQLEKHSDDLAVVWIDAHADINTLTCTKSGNIHGCPVSFLMGIEGVELSSFSWLIDKPKLKPENIVYIGLRDVEAEEELLLEKYNIRRFGIEDVRSLGIKEVMKEVLNRLEGRRVHISFDIDALDPQVAPSTGTPVEGGLLLEEGLEIVKCIGESCRLVGMDVVEINPKMGSAEDQARTAMAAQDIIKMAFL